jgi:hypothetical protein
MNSRGFSMSLRRLKLLLMFCFCLSTAASFAQQFTGHVSDNSGAAIPNAAVTVHNVETNANILSTTTKTGDYTAPYLKPGVYNLTAAAPGFKSETKTQVTLQVGQTATINFLLPVGSVTESVVVAGGTPLLDFGKADQGDVVESTRVTELPLNGRDPFMLATLSAGVIWTGYVGYQRPFDDTMANLSINGGGSGNNEIMLDGVSNESAHGNSNVGYVPPVDAVQEFKIVTNPYDAHYGRAQGGVVDMSLKSGTNDFHGTAYEFMRRGWLDANTYSNNYADLSRAKHWQDQYGTELEGPVRVPKLYDGRDKSFYMINLENYREGVPTTIFGSMPETQWVKNGDFSDLQYNTGSGLAPITLYDPLTLHNNGSGTLVRDVLPGNQITQSTMYLNPTQYPTALASYKAAQKIFSYYPAPNRLAPAGQNPWSNNYQVFNRNTQDYHNVLVKWDQNVGAKDRFFLRWGWWQRFENYNSNGLFNAAANGHMPYGEKSQTFAGDWVHTVSTHFIIDTRATVISRNDFQVTAPQGYNDISELGWPSALQGQMGPFQDFPNMNISEFTGMGSSTPIKHVANSLALAPTATLIKGQHTISFGADVRLLQDVNKLNSGGASFYSDRTWTQRDYLNWDEPSGNSIASMLIAAPVSNSNSNFSIPTTSYDSRHYFAPWVQDDWKVTHALTLNLGLRYDINEPITERHNKGSYIFDQTMINPVNQMVNQSLIPNGETMMGGITFLGVNGNPRTMYKLDKNDLQPRVGFAYAVNSKTTARGGVGLMIGNPTPLFQQPGFAMTTNYIGSVDGNKTPIGNMADPFPAANGGIVQPTGNSQGPLTGLGQGPSFVNPAFRNPKYWQYSFGFERQITKSSMVNASYVGTRTLDNPTTDNINHTSAAWSAKCNVAQGGNHNLCDATSAYVPSPFYGVAPFVGTGDYSSPTIRNDAFTRPFPEFGDITEYNLNEGKAWYNSLQVTGVHRWNHSLTMHANWTWSKAMDSGGWVDTVYRVPYRSIDGNDRTHRVALSGVYQLPFGRDRKLLPNANRWLDAAVGGWELAPMYIYETGTPWSIPNYMAYLHNARIYPHLDGGLFRGVEPCVGQDDPNTGQMYLESYSISYGCTHADFLMIPSYAPSQNTEYTGIRTMPMQEFNANMSKAFEVKGNVKVQCRLEAFNVLNHPLWQNTWDQSFADPNFGSITKGPTGQTNLPREVQLALKLIW